MGMRARQHTPVDFGDTVASDGHGAQSVVIHARVTWSRFSSKRPDNHAAGLPTMLRNLCARRAMLHGTALRVDNRPFWSGHLSIGYTGTRPVMVFTAGAPGSGKTYTLHRLYGLHNLEMLDLDTVMPKHPEYDPSRPEALYARSDAYSWANECIEARFQEICLAPWHSSSGLGRMVCFDGTGTHVERQKRRMWEAKAAGFWITQLYVQVSLATSLRRNLQRNRTVPEDVLRSYVDKLDDAVHAVSAEPGLVDEAIAMDNNRDDEHQSEAERWGQHLDWVQDRSKKHSVMFDTDRRPS